MKGLNDEIWNFWTIEKSFVNRKKEVLVGYEKLISLVLMSKQKEAHCVRKRERPSRVKLMLISG